MAEVFISYRRVQPDAGLANALHAFLHRNGVDAFLDHNDIPLGSRWDEVIGVQLNGAATFIVVVSQHSILSDMVTEEVRRAHAQQKKILPIRVSGLLEMPFQLAAMLNPSQRAKWDPADGFERICEQILAAVRGHASLPEAGGDPPTSLTPGALGQAVEDGAPLSEADRRIVIDTGNVPLDSKFYVRRSADQEIEEELALNQGRTVVIRGTRQSGKSSLLLRAHDWAQQHDQRSWFFSFEELGSSDFQTLDSLLRQLAICLADGFGTVLKPADVWDEGRGPMASLRKFVERAILAPAGSQATVLCLDELDLIFQRPYSEDFLGMLRTWHNDRARLGPWRNLTLVLTHSTEPSYWIRDKRRSPFNVAHLRVTMADFSVPEIDDLNHRYGRPLSSGGIIALAELLGGQPYLVRQALYTMKKRRLSFEALKAMSVDRGSPFAEHLLNRLVLLENEPSWKQALRQILDGGTCQEELAFHHLLLTGLVDGDSRHQVRIRSELYRQYLRAHL